MLIKFSVKNFACFKDETVLDINVGNYREHQNNIINKGKYKGLSTALVYGANASGKTSLFKALTFAINMVKLSNIRQINEPLPVIPFKFDERTISEPSEFEFQFVAFDGIKYVYGFKLNSKRIIEEYLYKYKSSRPSKIFSREEEKYYFTDKESGKLEPLTRMNSENKFFIATATAWNSQSTKIPFEWFSNYIETFTNITDLTDTAMSRYKGEKSEDYKSFTERIMKEADINISKIIVDVKRIKVDALMKPFVSGVVINGKLIQPEEQERITISTVHSIKREDGSNANCVLNIAEESQATRMLFSFGPMIKDALDYGKTIIIDEIDRSMHPLLLKYILSIFSNSSINKNGAQLIVTTHDTTQMRLSIFRRDQYYFIEKDNVTGKSKLYSLNDFTVRNTESIEKGYLSGRYGAIPDIDSMRG